jgi:hypothetical protein
MRNSNGIVFGMLTLGIIFCCRAEAEPPATQPTSQGHSESSIEFGLALSNLTAAEAHALGEIAKTNPDDVRIRAGLLGYFFFQQGNDPDSIVARRDLILWMIRNHADDRFAGSPYCRIDPRIDREGYIAGKELWRQQIDKSPQSAAVIENAALFLTLSGPQIGGGCLAPCRGGRSEQSAMA